MEATEHLNATVQAVLPGPHGPYVVATAVGLFGSITFALSEPVWLETDTPERGAMVVLSDLRRKQAGWRALSARYFRPEDEQSSIQQLENGELSIEQRHRNVQSGGSPP
ncbi:MAG: hypothetical protein ACHQUB_01770 [Candidatus Saccharimonadia bacterium]